MPRAAPLDLLLTDTAVGMLCRMNPGGSGPAPGRGAGQQAPGLPPGADVSYLDGRSLAEVFAWPLFLLAWIRYAAGRASRSVSSWMPTAIFVRADECCRL